MGRTVLTPLERRYLFWQSCVGAAILNALINWGLGWLGTRALPILFLWRIPGVASDLTGTAFGVAFGTCIGASFQVRRDLERGRIARVAMSPGVAAVVSRFPSGALRRGTTLGALSIPVFAVPVVLVLVGMGVRALDRVPFLELKTVFAAFEGAVVTPFIVLAVLTDVARGGPRQTAGRALR